MSTELLKEIAGLRERNDFLEAENNRLKEISDNASGHLIKHFGLQPHQGRILECLARNNGNFVKAEVIAEFIESDAGDYTRLIKVQIFKIRRKIAPFEICAIKRKGYFLVEPGLSEIRAIMGVHS